MNGYLYQNVILTFHNFIYISTSVRTQTRVHIHPHPVPPDTHVRPYAHACTHTLALSVRTLRPRKQITRVHTAHAYAHNLIHTFGNILCLCTIQAY